MHNTKASSTGVGSHDLSIRVIDQVPISEDSAITVKLAQPALIVPTVETSSTTNKEPKVPPPVKVSAGVTAMWDGADEAGEPGEVDIESLGKEGRFCWLCAIPPQGKVSLTLQWDVAAPANTNITGLV